MLLPNFLIIGAPKAGTTSLYHLLKQHPEIYMSPVKEPGFFVSRIDRKQVPFWHTSDPKTYSSLFDRGTYAKAIGEATTSYLCRPEAAILIRYYIPDAKLIVMLRDPVERAWSEFLYRFGGNYTKNTHKLFADFIYGMYNDYYGQTGFYHKHLSRYLGLFERSRLKTYLYEDMKNNTPELLRDVFRFLGVDDTFVPNVPSKYASSGVPKNRILDILLHAHIKALRPFVPDSLYNIIFKLRNQNLVKIGLPPEIRKPLVDMYREDIIKLQGLLQRDLSKWLE